MVILPEEIQVTGKYNGGHSRQASHMLWIGEGQEHYFDTMNSGFTWELDRGSLREKAFMSPFPSQVLTEPRASHLLGRCSTINLHPQTP